MIVLPTFLANLKLFTGHLMDGRTAVGVGIVNFPQIFDSST